MRHLNIRYGLFKNNAIIFKLFYYPVKNEVKRLIIREKFDIVISSAPFHNDLLALLKNKVNAKLVGWQLFLL